MALCYKSTVTLPLFSIKLRPWSSPHFVEYQIVLLHNKGTCVWTTCPESLHESGTAWSWTRDLTTVNLTPNHYTTMPNPSIIITIIITIDNYVQICLICSYTAVRHWSQTTGGDGTRQIIKKAQDSYVIQHIFTDGRENGGMYFKAPFLSQHIHWPNESKMQQCS